MRSRRVVPITAAVAFVLSLTACNGSGISGLMMPIQMVVTRSWVATDPVQCLGNPWEQDWIQSHGGNYGAYPRDPSTPGLEPAEVVIIKDYYRRLGVVVQDVDSAWKHQVVCAACSCPEGYTLYLRVRPEDVEKMLALGYSEVPPR